MARFGVSCIKDIDVDDAVLWCQRTFNWPDRRRAEHAIGYMKKHYPLATLEETWEFVQEITNDYFYGESEGL